MEGEQDSQETLPRYPIKLIKTGTWASEVRHE